MALVKEDYRKYIMQNESDYRPSSVKHEVIMVITINGFGWALGKFSTITDDMEELTDDEFVVLKDFIKSHIPNISLRQAREALIRTKRFNKVTEILDSLEDEEEKLILVNYWEHSQEFERNHQYLSKITTALGMTDEDTDEFFLFAHSL